MRVVEQEIIEVEWKRALERAREGWVLVELELE
jgi:hypothetical protein